MRYHETLQNNMHKQAIRIRTISDYAYIRSEGMCTRARACVWVCASPFLIVIIHKEIREQLKIFAVVLGRLRDVLRKKKKRSTGKISGHIRLTNRRVNIFGVF